MRAGQGKARRRQERCETVKLDLCDMQTNLLLAWFEKGLRGNISTTRTSKQVDQVDREGEKS